MPLRIITIPYSFLRLTRLCNSFVLVLFLSLILKFRIHFNARIIDFTDANCSLHENYKRIESSASGKNSFSRNRIPTNLNRSLEIRDPVKHTGYLQTLDSVSLYKENNILSLSPSSGKRKDRMTVFREKKLVSDLSPSSRTRKGHPSPSSGRGS
jgi:hypothetical protein